MCNDELFFFSKVSEKKIFKMFLEAWVVFHAKNVSNHCIGIKINDISRTVNFICVLCACVCMDC